MPTKIWKILLHIWYKILGENCRVQRNSRWKVFQNSWGKNFLATRYSTLADIHVVCIIYRIVCTFSHSAAVFFPALLKNVAVLSAVQATLRPCTGEGYTEYATTWWTTPGILIFSPWARQLGFRAGSMVPWMLIYTQRRILHFESGIRGWHRKSLLCKARLARLWLDSRRCSWKYMYERTEWKKNEIFIGTDFPRIFLYFFFF